LGPLFSSWGENEPDMRIPPISIVDYEETYVEVVKTNAAIIEIAQATLASGEFIPILDSDTPEMVTSKIDLNLKALQRKFGGEQVGHYTRKDGTDIYFQVVKNQQQYYVYLLDPIETEVNGEIVT